MIARLRRQLSSRIKYTIILPYLILAAFFIFLITAVSFALYTNSLENQLRQNLVTSATNTGLALEDLETKTLEAMRPFVIAPANITDGISATVDAFEQNDIGQITKIVGVAKNYTKQGRIIAMDRNGVILVDEADPEIRALSPSLVGNSNLANDNPLIRAVLDGKVDEYGDKYASLISIGAEPSYTMFFVVAPVKLEEKDGSTRVVGALIFAEDLDKIMRDQLVPRSDAPITAILASKGTILTSYPPESDTKDLVLDDTQLAILNQNRNQATIEQNNSLFHTIKRDNLNFEVIYSPLRIRRSLSGYFVVGLPRTNIDNALQQTIIFTALAVVFAVLAALSIGGRITSRITRPLGQLVQTAISIKRGDLEQRSFVSSSNEIGTLATVLNDMTERLLDLYRTSRQVGSELTIGGVLAQTQGAIQRIIPDAKITALISQREQWTHYDGEDRTEIATPFSPDTLQHLDPVVDLQSNQAINHALEPLALNSRLVLPLRTQQHTIGVVTVQTNEPDLNVHGLTEPLSAIASITATAIQNAVLYTEVQDEAVRKQAILQSIADGVIVFDNDKRIMLVNHTVSEMIGLARETLVGKTFDELDLTPLATQTEVFGEEEQTTQLYQSNRTDKVLSINAAPVTNESDSLGEVFVLHDVTAERAIDRAKTDFIATISHELRTPLTSISGYSDLLLRGFFGDLNEEQNQYVQIIHQKVHGMVDVLQNVITIASIESGSMTPLLENQPVSLIVKDAVNVTKKAIKAKDLALNIEIPEELPSIHVDRDQLKLVLVQLLDNARRYTETGSITIRAFAHNEHVHIDVIDTGQGIDPADFERLFARFQRGGEQSGLTSKERGIGLGLTIAKLLVEGNNGTIGVQSDVGQGSTFSIIFPAVIETPAAHSLAATAS